MDLTNPTDRTLLALDALDALDAHDAHEPTTDVVDALQALDALQLGPDHDEHEIATALAELAAEAPPEDLKARVLGAALARRPAATRPPLGPEDTRDPVEGYRRATREIADVAATVQAQEWDVPTVHGWTVKTTIAHLAAVESWFGSKLGAGAFDTHGTDEGDHVGVTAPEVARMGAMDPANVVDEFRNAASLVTDALAGLDGSGWSRPLKFYAFDGPLAGNVVARMFELWIHNDDMRRALGRPLHTPDAGRLQMMTDVAVALLPAGLALADRPHPGKSARVVLTGPGGGVWTAALDGSGEGAGAPDVTLVADAVDFCRVVSRRLAVDALDVDIEGDRELGRDVLVGASMLAAD